MICIKDRIKNLNIVIGCPIGCRYCYAKNNAKRYHMVEDFSKPEFYESKLKLFEKENKIFLLTGMSDLAFYKKEWIEKIFNKAKETPNNIYLFLTKRPDLLNIESELDNLWFGVTVTSKEEKYKIDQLRNNVKCKHYHVTFEPLFNDLESLNLEDLGWIVVGTETGNTKGKISSDPKWVNNIIKQAKAKNIPIFMKEDLCKQNIFKDDEMIQDFPKEFIEVLNKDLGVK